MRQLDGRGFIADTGKPSTSWLDEYILPDDQPRVRAAIREAVRAKGVFELEHRVRRVDGTLGWTHSRAVPVLDERGEIVEWIGTADDVTERRRAETALRESEERLARQSRLFEQIASTTPDFIYVFDRDGRFLYANTRLLEVWGRSFEDAVGKNLYELGYPQWHADMHVRELRQVIETKRPIKGEVPFTGGSGISGVYEYIFTPVLGTDGEVEVIAGTTRDVTERRRAEESLAQTQRRLDSAVIAGEVGTFEWDIEADRLWGDRNFSRIFGVEINATGAAPLANYVAAIHPDDRAFVLERVGRTVETGCDYEAEYRITVAGGHPRWVIARGKGGLDASGRVVRLSGVVLDVTEQKQAEQLLAAQNRALELIATGAPLPDALGALTEAVEQQSGGHAVAAILLVDEEDGCSLRTGAAPSLPPEYCAAIDGIKAAPGVGTCADAAARNEVVVTPDLAASPAWAGLAHLPLALGLKAAWSMPIRAADGRVLGTFGTYFRDRRSPTARERQVVEGLCRAAALAVERRRTEAALQTSERRFRDMADTAPAMLWVTEPDGRCTFLSRGWYEFTGQTEEQGLGFGWADTAHPDDRAAARDAVVAATAARSAYAVDFRLLRADGEYRWVIDAGRPRFGPGGEFQGFIGSVIDITERKLAEEDRNRLLDSERAARAEAERASRMKDEFLATLSHELRTPLNAILGWSQILSTGDQRRDDVREGLATIERNARAQTQIIEDLLDMSRIISGKVRLDVQRLDLAAVVQAAIDTVRPAAEAKGVRIQAVLDPLAGPVGGDPNRLQQVFWNLLNNAVKFTPRDGRVQVLLERVNSHLEVSVIDTGEGIRPEFLPFVFDRFRQADASTTRRHGGLGLGLAIVRQLVELHGGTVRATSAGEGHGSTFTVAIPLAVIHAAHEPETEAGRRHPQASAGPTPTPDLYVQLTGVRVLVVDDEPDARTLLRRLLEDCHAEVALAHSAKDALDQFVADPPDVLVSDIGMPGEDGYSLIRSVRALPSVKGGNVPALALTAYARSEDRTRSVLAGFQMHMSKPVEPAELIAMVASLAGRTGRA
jgi:PAS domain S-box-containing protein